MEAYDPEASLIERLGFAASSFAAVAVRQGPGSTGDEVAGLLDEAREVLQGFPWAQVECPSMLTVRGVFDGYTIVTAPIGELPPEGWEWRSIDPHPKFEFHRNRYDRPWPVLIRRVADGEAPA